MSETVPAPPPPRRRTGLAIALVLSIVAVIALAVPLVMLAMARSTWEFQNAELRTMVGGLTDQVSARNARIAELEDAEAQLEALKAEYSTAVNDGAQGTETVQELEDIVDAYQSCVDAQAEHFTVLRNADRYVASSIAESEASIVDFCDQVSTAYAEFKASRG
ncbi:hypothetical protein [Demequina sp.]|uniref:hypothetical protein n=1 Tax=Demequina sp. TaxID=2050685 RepID=UPI0025FA7406|nr:hypothetical protein [Demequina sp.]